MIKTKKYRVSNKRKHLYKLTYTIYDFYQSYNKKDKVSRDQYIAILKDFFSIMVKKIITDRKMIELPYNLSTHRIQKVKHDISRTPRVDFNKTKLLGKTVYHLNSHSSGYYFRWYWYKYPYLIRNKKQYTFELTKKNMLLLAKEILTCNKNPYLKDYDALK
jgi:hypothetical protein